MMGPRQSAASLLEGLSLLKAGYPGRDVLLACIEEDSSTDWPKIDQCLLMQCHDCRNKMLVMACGAFKLPDNYWPCSGL